MKEVARIPLPPHESEGEFDHAAVDPVGDRLYVAHPSNDAVEVVDLRTRLHCGSLSGLRGVAGVWTNAEARLLFTSNRGEDSTSIFQLEKGGATPRFRVPTGVRPNGMAYDPGRHVLLVAGVGNPKALGSPPSLTFLVTRDGSAVGQVEAPGRTRWAIYHPATDSFYVNVSDPASVVAVRAGEVPTISKVFPIPVRGPHGLEQDPKDDRLYCACDEGVLVALDPGSGSVQSVGPLSGPPDVLWVNRKRGRLYCAVGDPGSVDVFDLGPARPSGRVATAEGAHTLTLDPKRDEVHVFLPRTHEDLVLSDPED